MSKRYTSTTLTQIQDWPELARRSRYSAAALAKLCQVNLRTLQRHYKKTFHQSPQRWLDAQRQLEAERLARSGERIKSIAVQLGYKQSSHFCRHFRNSHGTPATHWRATPS